MLLKFLKWKSLSKESQVQERKNLMNLSSSLKRLIKASKAKCLRKRYLVELNQLQIMTKPLNKVGSQTKKKKQKLKKIYLMNCTSKKEKRRSFNMSKSNFKSKSSSNSNKISSNFKISSFILNSYFNSSINSKIIISNMLKMSQTLSIHTRTIRLIFNSIIAVIKTRKFTIQLVELHLPILILTYWIMEKLQWNQW